MRMLACSATSIMRHTHINLCYLLYHPFPRAHLAFPVHAHSCIISAASHHQRLAARLQDLLYCAGAAVDRT
jgi:hypothetical protein